VEAVRNEIALNNIDRQEDWKWNLDLQCPGDNDDDRRNVFIESRVGQHAFRVGGPNNFASKFKRAILARNMGLLDISNPYDYPIDIREGGRPLIRNFCPQGRITVVVVLPFDTGMIVGGFDASPMMQNYVWTAEKVFNGRDHYKAISQSMMLYVNSWQQREVKDTWTINLQKIDRDLPTGFR
jgi:hypothetical protein